MPTRRDELTIAAGFTVKDSVLLLADSQYSGFANKENDDKIFSKTIKGAHIAFALAGDSIHAKSAIADCWEALQKPPSESTIGSMRECIKETLRRELAVYKGDQPPEYLVAIAPPGMPAMLYRYSAGAMGAVNYEIIGSGYFVAKYLLKSFSPIGIDFMSMEEAVLLGTRISIGAMRQDPHIGGGLQFSVVNKYGVTQLGAIAKESCIEYIDEYESAVQALLMKTYLTSISVARAGEEFKAFEKKMMALRERMLQPGSSYRMVVDCLTQAAVPQDHQQSKHDPSALPASQG